MFPFIQLQYLAHIRGGHARDLLRVRIAHRGQCRKTVRQVFRAVSFAMVLRNRHIRGIGFQHQGFQRQGLRQGTQLC